MMEKKVEKKLQVRNLRISFRTTGGKVQAVRDISFDLHKGETLAIVGESGSGKSVTSKAILGILAGNSIVEGGEILYDGMDLLKITEEDFYRLRGDKVAMIFQDPLSSLNPIMRIGKQLTEAMILKGKARQRTARENFRQKLALLEKRMIQYAPENTAKIKHQCETFRKFAEHYAQNELAYNTAFESLQDAISGLNQQVFLMEKNAFKEMGDLHEALYFAKASISPFVVEGEDAAQVQKLCGTIAANAKAARKTGDYSLCMAEMQELLDILNKAAVAEKPAFFARAYFDLFAKGESRPAGTMQAQNQFYAEYMAHAFMDEFEEDITCMIVQSDAEYLRRRTDVVDALSNAYDALEAGTVPDFKPQLDALCKQVADSIDPMDIIKDSAACTFAGTMKAFVAQYETGVRTNARKQAKYDREVRQAEARAAKGKSYKVAMPTTIDLDLVKENMLAAIRRLHDHYIARNEAEGNEIKRYKTDTITDYLMDNAYSMVSKVTKTAARMKALKLMDEVGIPEPRKRYKQYPFEFSGGMRQRIVIAIALAANPDILICDEPTTALDVTIQAQILELIQDLKKRRNLSVIFITHDLGVVANMADRIAVMYAGKVVEYGTSEEVFYEPAHPYTWALLSSMPDLDSKEKLDAIPGTPPDMRYPPVGDAFADRNAYAMQIDFERQPPQFPITETHWAATWLLHPNAPQVNPPEAVTNRIAKMKERMEAANNE